MTEQEKLEAAKKAAKDKVGEKRSVTVETIKFKEGSGSQIVFKVLDKAKKPLTLKEITERAVKMGIKNPARAGAVAKWFAGNDIAEKDDDDKFSLVRIEKQAEAEA